MFKYFNYLIVCFLLISIVSFCNNEKAKDTEKNHNLENYIWHYTSGGKLGDYSNKIVCDNEGNSYIIGEYKSASIKFGNKIRNGKDGIFLLKFDSNGKLLWDYTAYRGKGNGLCIDKEGNCYITGYFNSRDIDFGGGVRENNSSTADIFVVKIDKNGKYLWDYTAGGLKWDEGTDITIDSDNNILFTGNYESGEISLGGNLHKGWSGIFLCKLDNNGNFIWDYYIGGSSGDYSKSIKCDSKNNIYIAGYYFSNSIDFGGKVKNNVGNSDIFILKVSKYGEYLWDYTAGGSGREECNNVYIDKDDNPIICGLFESNLIDFGDGARLNKRASDIYVLKLNSNSEYLWDYTAGEKGKDGANSLATDSKNNIYITGYFSNNTNFGNKECETVGGTDIFVLKLSSNGKYINEYTIGGKQFDFGRGISINDKDEIFVTGDFMSDKIYFGNDNSNEEFVGISDVFVLKIKPLTSIKSDNQKEKNEQ